MKKNSLVDSKFWSDALATDGLSMAMDDRHARLWQEVGEFARNEILPFEDRLDEDVYPADIVQRARNARFFQRCSPERLGGEDLGHRGVAIVSERLAWADLGVAMNIVYNHLVLQLMDYSPATPEQRDRYYSRIVSGKIECCFAATEMTGSRVRRYATTATVTPDGYILNGEKVWVSQGNVADLFLVACTVVDENSEKTGLLIVEKDSPGISVQPVEKMGVKAHPQCVVTFNDVKLAATAPLGPILDFGVAHPSYEGWSQFNSSIAGLAIGISQRLFEEGIIYCQEKTTNDHPLLHWQTVQHKLLGLYADIQAARAGLWQTCDFVDRTASSPGRDKGALFKRTIGGLVSNIKCVQVALTAAQDVLRLHAAYGLTRLSRVEKLYRDVTALQAYGGTPEIKLDRIGAVFQRKYGFEFYSPWELPN